LFFELLDGGTPLLGHDNWLMRNKIKTDHHGGAFTLDLARFPVPDLLEQVEALVSQPDYFCYHLYGIVQAYFAKVIGFGAGNDHPLLLVVEIVTENIPEIIDPAQVKIIEIYRVVDMALHIDIVEPNLNGHPFFKLHLLRFLLKELKLGAKVANYVANGERFRYLMC
jgi:hypothetical protein